MATAANALTIEHDGDSAPHREITPREGASAVTPMDMIDRALSANASPDTLERLLALQERWEASQARKAFDEAMAAAKAEIPTITKNRRVGYEHKSGGGETSYRHEDLGEIARVVTPILAKHGLSYRFRTSSEINQPVSVTCIVSHRAGHSEENTLVAGADNSGKKNSIQAIGSTITYLQRYTLKAALGLAASSDDDGAKADQTEDDGPISDEQTKTIQGLIDEVGGGADVFCNYFKIEAIPDLPKSQFDRAVRAIEKKRAAK